MRTRLIFLLFLFVISFFYPDKASSQIPPDIKNAFIDGNSQHLANFFSKSIELFINQKEEVYSKAQAELIIKDFFYKHVPDTFLIVNEGNSDGISYTIGNLLTANGKFRIYLTFRKNSGHYIISRLNISEYK